MAYHKMAAEIREMFALDHTVLHSLAHDFQAEMLLAVHKQPSSLQALPSFLPAATGQEKGTFITIDFGGTNIRVSAVTLHGDGTWSVLTEKRRPLKDLAHNYDLTSTAVSGSDIFDFVADMTALVYSRFPCSQIAMTFSYPMEQQSKNEARLLRWTKELKPSDTIGKRIDSMLLDALSRRGLDKLSLAAVINDTAACLLAGSYQNQSVRAGSICGTGHNTCCLYPYFPNQQPVTINLESGNFACLPANRFDKLLHQHSDDPGRQCLEKMVAGKYLGELWRLIYCDLVRQTVLPAPVTSQLQQPFAVSSEAVSRFYDDPFHSSSRKWCLQTGLDHYQPQHLLLLQAVSTAVIQRAMGLIAASFAGMLKACPAPDQPAVIAVDGSVFRFLPGFQNGVEQQLAGLLPGDPPQLLLTPEGSSIGAAVAAALPSV